MRLFGALGDDVDYAVYRVRPPNRTPWSTNDFNSIHILQHHILDFPISTSEQSRVDGASVDEHKDIAGKIAPEAANADRPSMAVGLSHFHARYQT